jgi:hypothetical protein
MCLSLQCPCRFCRLNKCLFSAFLVYVGRTFSALLYSLAGHDSQLRPNQTLVSYAKLKIFKTISSESGVLDEPDSAKPAQRSSYTGLPGYIGWTKFQPM